jgi:hypothetical protein
MTKREYLQYCSNLFEANAWSGPGSIVEDVKEASNKGKKGLKQKAKAFLAKHKGKLKTGAKVAGGAALVAGAAYGGKKIYDSKKKKSAAGKKKAKLSESYGYENFQELYEAGVGEAIKGAAKKVWNPELTNKDYTKIINKHGMGNATGENALDYLKKKTLRNRTLAVGAGALAATGGVVAARKIAKKKKAKKAKLSEAIEENGISVRQYLFDKKICNHLYDMSESVDEYREAKNSYFIEQRDAALQSGRIDAAEYYDDRLK